ncbi:MAG: hypothetical protein KKB37_02725 [Alphaproteobacteria bacterium]|nr:hypothetical protein [Alphaproteobacteria bacterium]
MGRISKAFVFIVFASLGASFWATTGLLYWEFSENWRLPVFEGALWFDLMTHHSHVFLFFPLFGTVALFAFFLPAAVFVDMYWRRAKQPENDIPFGKVRFLVGFTVTIALSGSIAYALSLGDETALWQIKREALVRDGGSGQVCAARGQDGTCARVTFVTALANVRRVSQDRERLTDLKRSCDRDPLIEQRSRPEPRRFCFVTAQYARDADQLQASLLDDKACCAAINRFETAVHRLHLATPDNRSWLDRVQGVTLASKVFFLLVILIISVLLAFRRNRIVSQYGDIAHRIDRGVLIGAIAMLFLPFMNHAYLLSTELIYGPNQPLVDASGVSFYRVPYLLSICFGIWGFFIMLFFIRRNDKEAERMSKIIGTIASGVFVLKYDTFIDYAVRFAGPGAGNQSVLALTLIAVGMLAILVWLKALHTYGVQGRQVANVD